jgi:hypothetical protein
MFVPRPNTGTLWPNEKRSDNHPDVRGDIFVEISLLKKLMAQADGDQVKLSVSGWRKEIAGKKALSLSVSEPYVKSAPKAQAEDEDVPF